MSSQTGAGPLTLFDQNSVNNVAAFAQQGTVDWVALSKMQFSASVAVLGRLASAGIDPLTLAFGQAMCSQLPLGIHGEKVLREAMQHLTSVSAFADLIWFGVGVKHVLRDLVQTTQGSALVALCGALTECYSISGSAVIVHELANHFGAPTDLKPSFAQWEALTKVTAPVFNSTTFGIRVAQISKLSGLGSRRLAPICHPEDFAQVLLAIGRVAAGQLETALVRGESSLGWIAAWCDFVLCLRVQVRSTTGGLIFINYDPAKHDEQVLLNFTPEEEGQVLQLIGKVYTVRSGAHLIHGYYQRDRRKSLDPIDVEPTFAFLDGRVSWETMLQDTFGGPGLAKLLTPETELGVAIPSECDIFSTFVVAATSVIIRRQTELIGFDDEESYLLTAIGTIPELQQSRHRILREAQKEVSYRDLTREESLERCVSRLHCLCGVCECFCCSNFKCQCRACQFYVREGFSSDENGNSPASELSTREDFCLPAMAETIVRLCFLLSCIKLDSPIYPKRSGLLALYNDADSDIRDTSEPELGRDEQCEYRSYEKTLGMQFRDCLWLFQDTQAETYRGNDCTARSDGKLYCYVGIMEGLSADFTHASVIHVGSGAISHGRGLSSMVYDRHRHNDFDNQSPGYPARDSSVVSDISTLWQDTSSPGLQLHGMVEEKMGTLTFWYRISSNHGTIMVSPGQFLVALRTSLQYKLGRQDLQVSKDEWMPILGDASFILVRGEGRIASSHEFHILRPLSSNTLGRCVAISLSAQYVSGQTWSHGFALVKNQEDLHEFAKFWIVERRKIPSSVFYYCLIS